MRSPKLLLCLPLSVFVFAGLGLGVALLSKRVVGGDGGRQAAVYRPSLGWVFFGAVAIFFAVKMLVMLVYLDTEFAGMGGGGLVGLSGFLFPDVLFLGKNTQGSGWAMAPQRLVLGAAAGSIVWAGMLVVFAMAFRRIVRG